MSKKDNPVPSLDDLFKEFSHSNREQGVFSYNEFLKNKLQNGVETNNERPKSGHMTEISWGSRKHPDEYEGLNGDNTSYFRK
jgi:hypothetical protein